MTDTGRPEREVPEFGLISDEELPDDLQPSQNPLARDPEDDPPEGDGGPAAPKREGMPDMGEPGPTG
jgi:hypothetical protein